MKLKTVECFEYKSIRTSNPFEVGDVTCLVGKNESGKTVLLEALYRLNPVVPEHGRFDVTNDYPRVDVTDYEQAIQAKQKQPATVVKATFVLEDGELDAIEGSFGKGVSREPLLVLWKGYDNELRYSLNLDEHEAVKTLLAKAQVPSEVAEEASTRATLAELAAFLQAKSEAQAKAVADAQNAASTLAEELKPKALDDAAKLAESQAAQKLRARLVEINQKGLSEHLWQTVLKDAVPQFLYFDEYYQMDGCVNIQQLCQRRDTNQLRTSDRPMMALIELARLTLEQLLSAKNTQALVNNLEGASNHLSKQFLKYWSQNKHLQMKVDVRPALPEDPPEMRSGLNMRASVYDSIHWVSTLVGTRSKGFVWFFSFLAWFSQQKAKKRPLILLLDEPGLCLHASAQADLLRYIEEELKPNHQVIYTTHSPFMVDPTNFGRVRIVEDRSMSASEVLPLEQAGTKVISDVLEAGEGSLFPLQGALGYDLAQTLFVGPNSLIVEGPSDLLYLQVMSAILEEMGRESLRREWTVTPVGGADKVPTFAALLGSQKAMKVATLIDIQESDKQRIENLYKRKLLKKKQVLTFADFVGRAEADIEDMFDVGFYLGLVNAEFAASLDQPIAESALRSTPPRILSRIGKHLETHPLKDGVAFNHYRPARYFVENQSKLAKGLSAEAIDRFEAAFKALNALLK